MDPAQDSVTQSKQNKLEMLRQRIDEIHGVLEERRNSEIYGPPEMMEAYARENKRLQAEADSLEQELKALEME